MGERQAVARMSLCGEDEKCKNADNKKERRKQIT